MATSKLKAKSPEITSPGHTKVMIFGAPGVGKSWWATSFHNLYYIDCEGGAKLQHYKDRIAKENGVYMGIEDGSLDFPTLIEQVQALATEKHPYKTLVIDSITKIYETAIAGEMERLGDKDQFGASKRGPVASMRKLVNWIMRLNMNVIFIAHETSEWGLDAKGTRTEIGKTASIWDRLSYELDLVLQAVKRGGSRYAIVTKSRLTGFPDRDQFLLEYSEFSARYGKENLEADATPIVLATPEQVTEINRLLSIVKVEESTIEKWKKAASAEEFSEFNTDQAAKIIVHLGKMVSGESK